MIEVAIMLEGQDGLNWPRWQRLVRAVEDFGFAGLYRSDHFTNASPPDKDSLELWVSLAWLASHTHRIAFGPMVTPASFRDPVFTARMGYQIDDLSGGRLTLGVGAGWQVYEHDTYGYDLLEVSQRFARFEESLQVITGLLRSEDRFSFSGTYYRIKDARFLPRPSRPGGPPLLIGGNGERRTLRLAAQYADEWNAVYLSAGRIRELNAQLDDLLRERGRQPGDMRRSLMTGLIFGLDDAAVARKLEARTGSTREQLAERGLVIGTPGAVVDQLSALAEAGVQRVMLQWLELDDIDGLEALARTVLPQVQS